MTESRYTPAATEAPAATRPPADLSSLRVQTARGLACLLLVTYHVIGSGEEGGLNVPDGSLWRYFTDLFLPIRMPLFTFLSGFVYVYKPMLPGEWPQFARRKILRLGLPLLVASTVTYVTLMFVSHYHGSKTGLGHFQLHELWKIYLYPVKHMWFLQALIIVMIGVMILEAIGALATLPRFLAVFAVALLAFAIGPFSRVEFFSLSDVPFLMPFFLLGLGTNRFRATLLSPQIMIPVLLLFLVSFTVHAHLATFGHTGVSDRRALVAAALSFSAVLCLVRWLRPVAFFQWIGNFSFAIYLYHFSVVLLIFILAEALGLEHRPLLLALGLAGGILIPVLIEKCIPPGSFAQLLLLGQGKKSKATRAMAPVIAPAAAVAGAGTLRTPSAGSPPTSGA